MGRQTPVPEREENSVESWSPASVFSNLIANSFSPQCDWHLWLNPHTFYNFSSLKVKACQLNFMNSRKKWGSSTNSSLYTSDQTSPHYTSILLPLKVTIAEHNHTKSKLQTLYIMEVVNSLEVYFLVPEQHSEPIYKFLGTVAGTKHICSA